MSSGHETILSDALNLEGTWCVRIVNGTYSWSTWPLSESVLGVGRGLGCQLRLDDTKVSRIQCELTVENKLPQIRNRSTRNPTLVNGEACSQQTLRLGDLIEFAGYRLIVDFAPEGEKGRLNVPALDSSRTTQYFDRSIYLSKDLEVLPQYITRGFASNILSLFAFLRDIGQCRTLDSLIEKLRIHLLEHFSPDSCWIAWQVRVDGEMAFYPPVSPTEMLTAPIKVIQEVCRSGKGQLTLSEAPIASIVLAAPIIQGGVTFGALAVQQDAQRGHYAEEHLHYLLAMAESSAPMIRAVEHMEQLQRDEAALGVQLPAEKRMLGSSKVLSELRAKIRRAAAAKNNVLIMGETGVGKELAARMLHDLSARSAGPYVVVNCASIPENLFESEIFGHEKGAFTGATHMRKGLFEQAHGGTFFLDEVGELSPANQARLLRVVETNTFRRVGGDKETHVDVRIVCATNRNLTEDKATQYRRDLYYRLSGVMILIPPLRQRKEDIPELALKFLMDCSLHAPAHPKYFSEEVLAQLVAYDWPGNIRELRNVIERATYEASGHFVNTIELPKRIHDPAFSSASPLKTLDEVESDYLCQVLRIHNYNVANAAEGLGIPASTLYYKLRKHRIELQPRAVPGNSN